MHQRWYEQWNCSTARGNCVDRKRRRGKRYTQEYITVPTICFAGAFEEAVIGRPITTIGQMKTKERTTRTIN